MPTAHQCAASGALRVAEIVSELAALSELREKPAGTIRITAGEHAACTVLWPVLVRLLPDHPDIKVEVIVDYGLTDIVAERFDAGIRLGERVAKDMIAVRIGPDMRMAVARCWSMRCATGAEIAKVNGTLLDREYMFDIGTA